MPLFRKTSVPAIFQPSSRELRIAASQGDIQKLTELLRSGARSLPDKDGRTPLHLATLGGHAEAVEILLRDKADPDAPDRFGYTPLHRAAMEGHTEIALLLLESGASTKKQDFMEENSPMHEAGGKGQTEVLGVLLSAGGDVYRRNKAGATVLHSAAQHGRTGCVKLLLKQGMKPNPLDKYDDTPLHTAVRYLHAGATQLLTMYGAKLNEQNRNGDTPLHLSCNLGQKKLTKLLVQAGGSISIRNNQGESPMSIAQKKQHVDLIQILKSSKSDVNGGQKSGRSKGKAPWNTGSRQSKIRERLKSAKETASKWELLFQDWPSINHKDPRTWNYTNEVNLDAEFPPLRPGEQYFVDLGGNVQKGPAGSQGSCYCAPYLCHLAKQNTDAQQELLEEIDACHDNLSHEISDLRHVTKCYLTELRRRLKRRNRGQNCRGSRERKPREDSSKGGEKQRMLRSRSESELETDVERGRMVEQSTEHSDSLSNASDDLYLEQYWRSVSSSQDSHRSHGSSRKGRKGHKEPVMARIQETLQETMMQFNRLNLDDSCTTPTSGSSRAGGRVEREPSSPGPSSSPVCPPSQASSPRLMSTLYSGEWNSDHPCPQPPSLDSGYGTGISPSPALRAKPRQPALEVSTQTEGVESHESHVYTELEAPLPRMTRPKLHIPPPPRHPLPPLPSLKPMQQGISTNV